MQKCTFLIALCLVLVAADRPAIGAEHPIRFSLNIYSGRIDPNWDATDKEIKNFTARFDTMKTKDVQKSQSPVLGYRGFTIHGFRFYDRVWVWQGIVEATRDGKTYQWDDEGRALEKCLLELSKSHISENVYKMATTEIDKK